MNSGSFWFGRRVLVTGHTGFKGSWLSHWLLRQGANVHGIALPPEERPSLFGQLELAHRMGSCIQDIRDAPAVTKAIRDIAPDTVFHLAAQSLVRRSYLEPLFTWDTNVNGTANVLQAIADLDAPCTVVVITSDKVYRNEERTQAFVETDPLGGHDPYSASKAACELLADSWRKSFLKGTGVFLATARAGNVIGGGDWATDRILPDMIRATITGEKLTMRNPHATRPWQHVLDPLNGYLNLAQYMTEAEGAAQEAWNFGPDDAGNRTVLELVTEASTHWPCVWEAKDEANAPHEANLLSLSTDKAKQGLGWSPRWGFEEAVQETVAWYRAVYEGESAQYVSDAQIAKYEATS